MIQTSLNAGFAAPAGPLRLQYVKEDNLLPSEVAAAERTQDNINAGCYVVPERTLTEAEERARDELLHHHDQLAWPIRKLRLYPADAAVLRCNYGAVRPLHRVQEAVDEIVVFAGSDQVQLESVGDPSAITIIGRAYDETGAEVEDPQLVYRGAGVITCDRKLFARVAATYQTEYRLIELTVVPTGENFEVQVIAFQGGETASTLVPYEMLEFDTGQVAGVNCGGGLNAGQEPVNAPPPAARYEMLSMSHGAKVEKDAELQVTMTFRNINAVAGTGAVKFGLQYGPSVSGVFNCDANGVASINLSLSPDKVGTFATFGEIIGDFFSQQRGSVEVTDPDAEPAIWREVSREMTDIDVDGVGIKRIEKVTFDLDGTGELVTLAFDNTEVQ